MKPLATLYLTRKKLYIRECEEGMFAIFKKPLIRAPLTSLPIRRCSTSGRSIGMRHASVERLEQL